MWLFALFVAVPLVEIALFIQVGGLIGLWPTLLIVLLTAMLGTWMVRSQGALAMAQLRGSFNRLSDPTEPLAHGAMVLVAGVLLLTPGFFTDALGFLLLVPAVRSAVFRYLKRNIKVSSFAYGSQPPHQPPHQSQPNRPQPPAGDTIIEGEFTEADPPKRPTHAPSGWTRH